MNRKLASSQGKHMVDIGCMAALVALLTATFALIAGCAALARRP